MPAGFRWKGSLLSSMDEILKAAVLCKSKEDAAEFLKAYRVIGISEEEAKNNLGYYAAYYGQEALDKVIELFDAVHPQFGKTLPGHEKAFQMGLEHGKKMSRRN